MRSDLKYFVEVVHVLSHRTKNLLMATPECAAIVNHSGMIYLIWEK